MYKSHTDGLVVNVKNSNYDVYIGRKSNHIPPDKTPKDFKWGNPFTIGPDGTRDEVIHKYANWIKTQPELVKQAKEELKGKVLGCWCYPQHCHGNILAKIANE